MIRASEEILQTEFTGGIKETDLFRVQWSPRNKEKTANILLILLLNKETLSLRRHSKSRWQDISMIQMKNGSKTLLDKFDYFLWAGYIQQWQITSPPYMRFWVQFPHLNVAQTSKVYSTEILTCCTYWHLTKKTYGKAGGSDSYP